MKTKKSKAFIIILALIILVIGALSFTNCFNRSTTVDTGEFNYLLEYCSSKTEKNKFKKNEIKDNAPTISGVLSDNAVRCSIGSISIDTYNIEFTINCYVSASADSPRYSFSFSTVRAYDVDYTKLFKECGIYNYDYVDPNAGSIWSSLLPILGTVIIAVVFFILIMQTQGGTKGAMNFAKTNARLNHNVKVRFNDVAGAEEEKEELCEVVDFLKNPKKFSDIGARIPKGVLLVGPPGTGKTLFAKAVAGEAGVPFFSISGSDFVEMFVGVGASRVRDLFDTAKKNMPCIVFIDEIDAVGRQRGSGVGGGNDEREQTLNQLLVQMDGFETNDGIIVMAATNRADILDPALMRPGRFDRQIYVNTPDVKGREAILKVHARNKPLAPDVNFKTVARMTSGFSGADLENLLNEAAILAARDNRKFINNKDLYEGINKVLMGPQKKSRLVTETDKRITAYHEAGHAILAKLLPNCDPVHEVSIIPRGQAAGYTMTRPDNDDNHLTKAKLLDDIVMTMGGRVAEELIIKDISAGASGDIQAVSKRARLMVTEWGMSEKIGPISYGSDKELFLGRDMQSHVSYSEETAGIIDQEIERIIKDGLNKARELLAKNKKLLDTMARVLIERETIFTEEVNLIMEGKTPEEVMKFMDENERTLRENPFERKTAINNIIIKKEEKAEVKNTEEKPKEESKKTTAKKTVKKTTTSKTPSKTTKKPMEKKEGKDTKGNK